jgi:hypothetical protein
MVVLQLADIQPWFRVFEREAEGSRVAARARKNARGTATATATATARRHRTRIMDTVTLLPALEIHVSKL